MIRVGIENYPVIRPDESDARIYQCPPSARKPNPERTPRTTEGMWRVTVRASWLRSVIAFWRIYPVAQSGPWKERAVLSGK